MKTIVLLLVLFAFSSNCLRAHAFFFAYAEVSIDEVGQRIESTLIATTHDLELVFEKENITKLTLEKALNNEASKQHIESFLNRFFYFEKGLTRSKFKIDGYEIKREGTIELYISSEWQESITETLFTFNLLMNNFPEQQNKALIIWRNLKKTMEFLPNNSQQLIRFE
jgi:hypothetical protein